MKGSQWSESAVNKVVPRRYPSGEPIPPEVRREIYAYYLTEQKLRMLKKADKMSGRGKKKLRRVV